MKIHQFRFIREIVKQNFNLTSASKKLLTSQPGVSKSIIEFEQELGIKVFLRHGKRITGLTEPGLIVYKLVEQILFEIEKLKNLGLEYASSEEGSFTIGTTHTQARYSLPKVIKNFSENFPNVKLTLLQGNPKQIGEMVLSGRADVAIATETITDFEELVSIPCFNWEHVIIVPKKHDLLELKKITLKDIISFPIITYDKAFAGRKKIDLAFSENLLEPNIFLEAMDADVIKTYVELEMGIGIISSLAFDCNEDKKLSSISAGHLFGTNVSFLAVRNGAFLRNYIYNFIEFLMPDFSKNHIYNIFSNIRRNYEFK